MSNPTPEIDTFWGRCSIKTKAEKAVFRAPFSDDPHWRDDNTCSHCGGIKPSVALDAIRIGAKVTPTDKNYKIYVEMPDPLAGQDYAASVITVSPSDPTNPADEGYVEADPEILKRDGWGDGQWKRWMKLAKRPPTKSVKCYLNHFSESQAVEFARLEQTGVMKLAYPGWFYGGLCFGIYKDAIEAMVKTLPKKDAPEESKS